MSFSIEDSKIVSKIAGNPWPLMVLSFFLFGLSGYSCIKTIKQQKQMDINQLRVCLSTCSNQTDQNAKVCNDVCSPKDNETKGLFGFAFGVCGLIAAIGYAYLWGMMRQVAVDVLDKFSGQR